MPHPTGDTFYDLIWPLGAHVFWATGRPTVLGAHHTRRRGGFLLAATHSCPYDVPLLMCHAARDLDFVSSTEVFANPMVARFYGGLNAFPHDRGRPDPAAARTILARLRAGRAVAIFPEGGFRKGPASVLHTRRLRPSVARLAAMAGAPIVPAVLAGAERYARPAAWLPLRRTRYGVAFGPPLRPTADPAADTRRLVGEFVRLHAALREAML